MGCNLRKVVYYTDFRQFKAYQISKFKSLSLYLENMSQITVTMYSEYSKNIAEESTDSIKLWFNSLDTKAKVPMEIK